MSPDRLLEHLVSDSPRWLGEAGHQLASSERWVREGRSLKAEGSPLLAFYRCIHGFKGACSLMAERLPVAARITARLHEMEGRLAIRQFVRSAMKVPLLERDEELDLARRWHDKRDVRALHLLVQPHMRLVIRRPALTERNQREGLVLTVLHHPPPIECAAGPVTGECGS